MNIAGILTMITHKGVKMPRVVHFEINALDPERAMKFYEKAFGWWFSKWDGPFDYWLVMTGKENQPGIDGGLMKGEVKQGSTVNTLDVASIDEAIRKVEDAGGKIVRPKNAIPGVGWIAYFQDTEGNQFGMMQTDTNAK